RGFVQIFSLRGGNGREQGFGAARRAAIDLVIGQWRAAVIWLRPFNVNALGDTRCRFGSRGRRSLWLRRVESGKEATTARLACDGGLRAARSRRVGQRRAAWRDAAVGVTDEDAPLFINRAVDEVEQVAVTAAGGAARADGADLDRIIRRRVDERIGLPTIKCR